MGLDRFERSTSPLSGVRSNRLSYRPALLARDPDGSLGPCPLLRERSPLPPPRSAGQSSHACRTETHSLKTKQGKGNRSERSTSELAPLGAGLVLRKEVIQPQVPLRLPCYDFVPLTGHTFDASLRFPGWASGFGCSRLR